MYTGAALELAAENANRQFGPNITLNVELLYGKNLYGYNATCIELEGTLVESLARYYYYKLNTKSCVAILASGT